MHAFVIFYSWQAYDYGYFWPSCLLKLLEYDNYKKQHYPFQRVCGH